MLGDSMAFGTPSPSSSPGACARAAGVPKAHEAPATSESNSGLKKVKEAIARPMASAKMEAMAETRYALFAPDICKIGRKCRRSGMQNRQRGFYDIT
jgi:hypothetical protein